MPLTLVEDEEEAAGAASEGLSEVKKI